MLFASYNKEQGKNVLTKPQYHTIPRQPIPTHTLPISANHHPSITSYAIILQSPIWPWTQDPKCWYCWVKWAPAINHAPKVYLSFVDPVYWCPTKIIHLLTRTITYMQAWVVDSSKMVINVAQYTQKHPEENGCSNMPSFAPFLLCIL